MNVHPNYSDAASPPLCSKASLIVLNSCTTPASGLECHESGLLLPLQPTGLHTLLHLSGHEISSARGRVPEAASGQRPVRKATRADLPAIVELERDLTGIERPGDYQHFIENPERIWSISVCDSADGNALDGVLCSVCHPATNMIGPGCARNTDAAEALLIAQLNENLGRSPVALVPCSALELRNFAYSLGAKNTEIHVAQCRGTAPVLKGLTLPSCGNILNFRTTILDFFFLSRSSKTRCASYWLGGSFSFEIF